jgi:diacylglycerol kinase family enzyme
MTFIKGLFSGWRLFNGSIDKLEEMTMLRANKVEIIPDDRVYYHLDGESYITSNSLTFNILPGQLKVLVPL